MNRDKRNQFTLATIAMVIATVAAVVPTRAAVNPTLVSRAANGDNGNSTSRNFSTSGDGRYIAFESQSTNLIAGLNDTNGTNPDIFLKDTVTNTLRCISLANPTTTGNSFSTNPIVSYNGQYVVFASGATNLVTVTDTNADLDVYRYNIGTGQIEVVSMNVTNSAAGNSYSGNTLLGWHPYDMSDDGRYVAFMSHATDLTLVTDTNDKSDVFVRDMQTQSTRLVSINKNGTATGNNDSYDPSVTADGQSIAFTSAAGDLTALDLNSNYDIFVYNQQTQVTQCASLNFAGGGNGTGTFGSFSAVIAKNGGRVAYFTAAQDLTRIDVPFGYPHNLLVVHDFGANENFLVSIDKTGTTYSNDEVGIGNVQNLNLSISADGRYISFESRATNLVNTPSSGYNVFRRDLTLGRTELVTINTSGTQGGTQNSFGGQRGAGMSRDGRFISFYSPVSNLVTDFPTSTAGEIYVRDMASGITTLLSLKATGTAPSANTSFGIPSISANGRSVVFDGLAADLAPPSTNITNNIYQAFVPTPQRPVSDFDGDGVSDFSVYRPAQGAWYVLNNAGTSASYRLHGNASDTIVPADYNGDGRTDYAVFRASTGTWYISDSLTFGENDVQFGQAGDVPVPQDYDGDGSADLAVYRNATFYWIGSRTGQLNIAQFGLAGDIPVLGDFDGDGRADLAVFRPSTGTWYAQKSSSGALLSVPFGQNDDKPVPADYDGDGKTDLAVFRAGTWWILGSRFGDVTNTQFGLASDIPAPGSFDADGKADFTVFRPSEGNWYVLRSTDGNLRSVHFGLTGDVPVPAAFTH
jgi:hypothetical protein